MSRRYQRDRRLNFEESEREDKRREQLRLKLNLLGILALLIMLAVSFDIAGIGGKVVRWLTGVKW